MNTHTLRNKWTKEHISYLEIAYLQGAPLKTIASKLNRSVSAINKVLARHNLRTHSKITRTPPLMRPSHAQIQKTKQLGSCTRKRSMQKGNFQLTDNRQEVSFERVIFWLKTQNIYVAKSSSDVYYEVNGRPMNKQQILYHANMMREKCYLPIFWVKDVTFS